MNCRLIVFRLSDDDQDFIEVTINPSLVTSQDELFPASIFQKSAPSTISRVTTSHHDVVHPAKYGDASTSTANLAGDFMSANDISLRTDVASEFQVLTLDLGVYRNLKTKNAFMPPLSKLPNHIVVRQLHWCQGGTPVDLHMRYVHDH